jgi:hypothetical protein
MLEFLLGWPATLTGGVALGILGNLLTPLARNALASTNQWRRDRLMSSLLERYERLHARRADGSLIYSLILSATITLTGVMTLWGTILFLVMSEQSFRFNRQFAYPDIALLSDAYPIWVLRTFDYISIAMIVYLLSRVLSQLFDNVAFGVDPDKYRNRLLQRLRRLDPQFEERRLDGCQGDSKGPRKPQDGFALPHSHQTLNLEL